MSAGTERLADVSPPGPLVLVVASPERAEETARCLAGLGDVLTLVDPDTALECVRTHRPALVVLDGDAAVPRHVSRLRLIPEGRLVPLVAVAEDFGSEATAEMLAAGADDCLSRGQLASLLGPLCAARLLRAREWGNALADAREACEQAEAAGRARDEFLAVASHELRTPLGALLIWSQLLRSERMDEEGLGRALGMIERSSRNLAQLVDDLLDVSRAVSGKLRLELRPLELGPVVEAAVRSAQPSNDKRLEIGTEVDGGLRAVSGDAARLQQVVGHLLTAAMKSAPAGARLAVRLQNAGDRVRLLVSDVDVGPERRSEVERKLGLRLTLVRRLVELHGGCLEMGPADDSQALFCVTLPALTAVSFSGAPAESPAAAPEDADALRGLRVLLVDDEDDARDALTLVLERSGASVRAVGSAAAALEALQREPPDVLLSDISMPNEDGYSLMRRIRGLPAERGGGVPAAAVTAYASDRDREMALGAGYLAHVAKPVEPHALVDLVVRLARGVRRRGPGLDAAVEGGGDSPSIADPHP